MDEKTGAVTPHQLARVLSFAMTSSGTFSDLNLSGWASFIVIGTSQQSPSAQPEKCLSIVGHQ
jgi:hypothetical protein